MKRLALLLLLLSLSAGAQTFPPIAVYPSTAVKGVTKTIIIRAERGWGCNDTPIWCGVAGVTIGGKPSPSVEYTNLTAEIEAAIPDLPAGTVADVAVTDTLGNIRRKQAAVRIVDPQEGYSAEAFDRVLIPVIYEGPGLNGSRWTTDVWLMNGNTYDFPFLGGPVPELVREQSARVSVLAPNGYVLYPARNATDDLSINVLVRDLSRQSKSLGTEIPAVRERDLESRRVLLLNVPSDPKFRLTLRVYSLDPLPAFNRMNYWLYDLLTGEQRAFGTVDLVPPADEHTPWSATIGDLAAKHPEILNQGPLRLSISPVRSDVGGARFWAFLTVTNNETQEVTAITPNP